MPLLSEFYGMKIYMYYDDHLPPHFHLLYEGVWYIIGLNGDILKGDKPPSKVFKMIKEWTFLHEKELYDNWDNAQNSDKLNKIDPLR